MDGEVVSARTEGTFETETVARECQQWPMCGRGPSRSLRRSQASPPPSGKLTHIWRVDPEALLSRAPWRLLTGVQ